MGVFIRFFFKQKTAYEMRSSDWSSDVCSSDLRQLRDRGRRELEGDVGLRAVLLEVVGPQGRPDDRQVGTQDPVVVQARHVVEGHRKALLDPGDLRLARVTVGTGLVEAGRVEASLEQIGRAHV